MIKPKYNYITLDEFLDKIKSVYKRFCFKKNGDLIIVISGPEGAGKSMLALAISCDLDGKFSAKHIYYGAEDYVLANLGAYKQKRKGMDQAKLEEYNHKKLNLDLIPDSIIDLTIKQGTVLLYDEAAQGLFNRRSMSGDTIDQVVLFTNNRQLNLCHALCIPDPSTLEKYVKKFRIKVFIWVEDIQTEKGEVRTAFIWNKKSYLRMGLRNDFEEIVAGGYKKMCKISPPNFCLEIPNLKGENKYIPTQIQEAYDYTKINESTNSISTLSILKKLTETDEPIAEEKKKTDHVGLLVLPDETREEWVKRTNQYPILYTSYGGGPDGKPKKKAGRPRRGEQWYDKDKEFANVEKEITPDKVKKLLRIKTMRKLILGEENGKTDTNTTNTDTGG